MQFTLSSLTIMVVLINSFYGVLLSPGCQSTSPIQKDDCIIQSTSTDICCYRVSNFGLNKSCVLVPYSLENYTPILNLAGNEVYTDCGPIGAYGSNTSSQMTPPSISNGNKLIMAGRPCGSVNPKIASDCNSYSVFLNSCCYYESQGQTGCYSLGRTFFGKATYAGYNVVCSGRMLQTYGLFLISLLALLLI